MVNSKILTVGIPTYNGSTLISTALDSVLKQISSGLETRVDILISDNASSDGVGEIIHAYQANHPTLIQYSRNDSNIGFDRNVDILFKKASGKYIWMLGDDDALEEGALLYVLDILDKYPSLMAIQVNFDKYDLKLEKIVQQVSIPEDLYCRDAETFLINSKGRWGAVSSLIINKDAWNSEDLSNGFGSQITFAFALFKILRRGDSYIIKQPLVKVRDGSEHNVKRGDGDALLRIALASGTLYHQMRDMGYSSKIIRWHLKADRPYAYNAIPLAKLWGIKNKLVVVKKLIAVHNGPVLWLKWFPVVFCPDPIFKIIYLFKKAVSSKTRPIEYKLKKLFRKPR